MRVPLESAVPVVWYSVDYVLSARDVTDMRQVYGDAEARKAGCFRVRLWRSMDKKAGGGRLSLWRCLSGSNAPEILCCIHTAQRGCCPQSCTHKVKSSNTGRVEVDGSADACVVHCPRRYTSTPSQARNRTGDVTRRWCESLQQTRTKETGPLSDLVDVTERVDRGGTVLPTRFTCRRVRGFN